MPKSTILYIVNDNKLCRRGKKKITYVRIAVIFSAKRQSMHRSHTFDLPRSFKFIALSLCDCYEH